MFTVKLKQANKIIADEKKNVCFYFARNKSPPVLNILNKIYTLVLFMVFLKERYLSERNEKREQES